MRLQVVHNLKELEFIITLQRPYKQAQNPMKALWKALFDHKIALNIVLILVPFLTYVKACYFEFSPLDDVWLIINNEGVIKDWANISEAFKQATSEMYYRPLLFDSFIVDYHIKGLNAHVFHFTNVVLHVLSVSLLFRFLMQYDVKKELAFVFSVLFAIHPVTLHAVAWVPGRNDVMLALACMAAIYFQNKYIQSKQNKYLILQLAFFVMALFTKETAVVMPLVFALNSVVKQHTKKRIAIELIAALIIAMVWYFYRSGIVKHTDFFEGDLGLRAKNFVSAFLIYSSKTMFPVVQSLYPTIENSSIQPGIVTIVLLLGAAWYFKFSNKPVAFFGLFFYAIFLFVPVWFMSTSITREQYENRLYLPMIGFVLFVANLNIKWIKQTGKLFLGVLGLLYIVTTYVRMNNYKDYMNYIELCIEDNPNNYFFRERYADELVRLNKLQGALVQYGEAIRILPSRALFYNNRGNVHTTLKMKAEALRDMDSAARKSNFDANVCLNRAMTYAKFGETDVAMAELNRLKQCCAQVVVPEAENEIRMLWTMNAFAKIDELLRKQPGNAVLYANRAKLFYDIGRRNEALADKQKALSLAPDNEQIKRYLENIRP